MMTKLKNFLIICSIIVIMLISPTMAHNFNNNIQPSQHFSVKIKFDFPAVLLNISNETGFSYNLSRIIINNDGDIDAQIILSYSTNPPNANITVYFSQNNFTLSANTSTIIDVTITILPRTVAGAYNLTINAKALPYPAPQGNAISYFQTYKLRIIIGGKSYRLNVQLRHPDGTPAHGTVRVAYLYEGIRNYMYQAYGSNLTFFVVSGTYVVEVWYGSKKKTEETVTINQNITLYIQFSTIEIRDFTIVSEPQSRSDNLIFSFTIANEDPLIYQKQLTIIANMYHLQNNSFVIRDIYIATILIRSTMIEQLIGSIHPPDSGWINGTYRLEIIVYSGNVIMTNYTRNINIIVIETPITIQQQFIPLLPLLMIALIAGLIGFIAAKKTTRIYRPTSKAPFKVRIVGVIAKGTLFALYDFARKRTMLMNTIDKEYPSFITLVKNIASIHPTSWLLEEHLPLAWSDTRIKVLIYPVSGDFLIMVVTNPKVNERDLKVTQKLRSLAQFVARIHEENNITYDYIMKRQREYVVHIKRIAEYVRRLGLA